MLSPQQKTSTLDKILFRVAHTYSKDSKKKVTGESAKKSGRPSGYLVSSKSPFGVIDSGGQGFDIRNER